MTRSAACESSSSGRVTLDASRRPSRYASPSNARPTTTTITTRPNSLGVLALSRIREPPARPTTATVMPWTWSAVGGGGSCVSAAPCCASALKSERVDTSTVLPVAPGGTASVTSSPVVCCSCPSSPWPPVSAGSTATATTAVSPSAALTRDAAASARVPAVPVVAVVSAAAQSGRVGSSRVSFEALAPASAAAATVWPLPSTIAAA